MSETCWKFALALLARLGLAAVGWFARPCHAWCEGSRFSLLPLHGILFVAVMLSTDAKAENVVTVHAFARPGVTSTVLVSQCVKLATDVAGVAIVASPSGQALTYTPPPDSARTVTVDAWTGGTASGSNADCVAAILVRVAITTSAGPEVPDGALKQAFNLLMAAFVLALLMESAFALLFNWRVFQEFVVGRAWRTIIMFGVSLVVVEQFELDLLASLFAAYHGGVSAAKIEGHWLTSTLTAMIIAGGSAGVNRIMVGLGFRSQVPKVEEEKNELVSRKLAYISVTVDTPKVGNGVVTINALDVPCDDTATLLGAVYRRKRGRLKALLFGEPGRFPRSGGYALDATRCYRISVQIVQPNRNLILDLNGKPIQSAQSAAIYRFAPGAIVDFVV